MSWSFEMGETVPHEKPAQLLIAEVPRRTARVERAIGVYV